MGAQPAHLAHAAELERRDEAVARELQLVAGLARRAAELRSRAAEIRTALERIPDELEELEQRGVAAEDRVAEARRALGAARERVEKLEAARRRRDDEAARARSELETAQEELTDAEHQAERLAGLAAELRGELAALTGGTEATADEAAAVAAEIDRLDRVPDAARREPGRTLAELEEWGGQVRSALFVARGTLETERERIVVEANALGSAVLGEELGASSVAVVRRRIERELG